MKKLFKKRSQKKHGGFSLVEVIVSVVFISAIANVILLNLYENFNLMTQTKGLTENSFSAMQSIEKKISSIRNGEEDVDYETRTMFAGTEYEVDVEVYPISYRDEENAVLHTLIGNDDIPSLPTPYIKSLEVSIENGTGLLTTHYTNQASAKSEIELDESNIEHYDFTLYQWYVSREGFLNESYDVDGKRSGGDDIPQYPMDFELLYGETYSFLSTIKDSYRGKHLILVATPVSKAGKMGPQTVSNSIYITNYSVAELPDPLLHYDAGLMSGEYLDIINFKVSRWSSFCARDTERELYNLSAAPDWSTSEYGSFKKNGQRYNVKGRTVDFTRADGQTLFTATDEATGDEWAGKTVFVVAKNAEAAGGYSVPLISSEDGSNKWALYDDGFRIEDQEPFDEDDWNNWEDPWTIPVPDTIEESVSAGTTVRDEWRIFGAMIDPVAEDKLEITHSINASVTSKTIDMLYGGNGKVTYYVGSDLAKEYGTVQIAEVIIYDRTLSTQEYTAVYNYLNAKYALS